MAQNLMTPGVYIEEKNAFPGSVVEVATAIPAFIGYTQKASRKGKSLLNQPTRITSLKEYVELFGEGNDPSFDLSAATDSSRHTLTIAQKKWAVGYKPTQALFFYDSIRLFYANGGSTCYIVSVGTFEEQSEMTLNKDEILNGLETLVKEQEPTMLLIPDAVNLPLETCYGIYTEMLRQCWTMQSRVSILDVFEGYKNYREDDVIQTFRGKIGTEFLNYAAAYYPWLHTNVVQNGEVTFENLPDADLEKVLPEKEAKDLVSKFPKDRDAMVDALWEEKPSAFVAALEKDKARAENSNDPGKEPTQPVLADNATEDQKAAHAEATAAWEASDAEYKTAKRKFDADTAVKALNEPKIAANSDKPLTDAEVKDNKKSVDAVKAALKDDDQADSLEEVSHLLAGFIQNKNKNYHLGLVATSPTYSNILDKIIEVRNLLPPSAAMAGIYTTVDNSRGVWKSPANISVSSVIKPSVNITHEEQESLNVDALSGKSINAIRTFPGIGTLVWGGRTLDGNSLDWQYINVRRTIIMLEQSIKLALRAYVFEPNDANTWVTVKSMIVNFLTEKWKQGALAGASPEDAFDVQIGLGSTMTAVDILAGKMLVSVKLAIVRPAEFIVVTFQQQMQKS